MDDFITIDCDRLRQDLITFFEGAYFVAGYGAALMDRITVDSCSEEELIRIALSNGLRVEDYIVKEKNKHK